MPTVYTEVEVDVDLDDFDTDDLLEELERRGSLPVESNINAKDARLGEREAAVAAAEAAVKVEQDAQAARNQKVIDAAMGKI